MAKKVKFPLDMGNEVYVRTLEELKENYNSEKVTEYFLDGRLLTWLNDRYFDDEAEQVQELMEQEDKNNLAAKLGKIFGVEIQDDVDVENLEIRREKLEKLRQITADDEVLKNADSVAFSQEELGDLLDNGAEVIYLCGEKFRIPLSVKNVRYIGVNNPVISISSKGEVDLEASGISIVECEFSDDTRARLAVKKENKDIVEHKNIVKHKDIAINKDPLHIKGNSDISRIVNALVDAYHLNNPTPFTTSQMKEHYIHSPFSDSDKIILTGQYFNFTSKKTTKFAKTIPNQSKYAAESIKKHNHILCFTDDNNEAFASGCLFRIGLRNERIFERPYYNNPQIYIKPEKYIEFLEKFAVTSVIAIPCRENISVTDLTRMVYNQNPALEDIIPLIYIDMEKVVDDMCNKLGKTVDTLERDRFEFDLGDYGIYCPGSGYSNISDFKYDDLVITADTAYTFENRYTNNIFTATGNYVNAIMNLLK